MIKWLTLLLILPIGLFAQTEYYFSFDNFTVGGEAIETGDPEYDCGVSGNAIVLDGITARINFTGAINNEFNQIDFSISFYFKPESFTGTQDILSKLTNCTSENAFSIRYNPFNRTVNALLSENASKQVLLNGEISPDACWQHVAVVRDNNEFFLYINGALSDQGLTSTRADISNTAPLSIADSPCVGATDVRFTGAIDELRVYARALPKAEIAELYTKPDAIITKDTLLVLGDEVNIEISNTCVGNFQWSPVEGVADPKDPTTTITPPIAGDLAYYLEFQGETCTARDSIIIRVVSPEELNCSELFLPNAFTPNGDNTNDTYGISNPFVVEDLVSFEIFDRWGNRVFQTDDPRGRWDGTYSNELVNPGVLLYRIVYNCRDEELTHTGSVTLLR
ncbi:MAG: LamG-like jellyroll fold domain-containing protein [Bacteroidota bacterium]